MTDTTAPTATDTTTDTTPTTTAPAPSTTVAQPPSVADTLHDIMVEAARLKTEVATELTRHNTFLSTTIATLGDLERRAQALGISSSATVKSPTTGGKVAQRVVKAGPNNPGDGRSRRVATDKQGWLINKMCDEKFARVEGGIPTMLAASQIIDQLKALEDVPQDQRDLSTALTPAPEEEKVKDKLDINVLRMIPNGRYAVTADDGKQTVFLKVAELKTNDGTGQKYRDVKYKSSDNWLPLQKFWPSGQVTGKNSVHGSVVADLLVQVMMDKEGCADRYGERFEECVNCGRELTDDRSRYYRLGSECIQHRDDIVEYIENTRGPWVPGAASQD
ncbi:hypothetical protein SEA_NEWT_87 [Gordonia phage Newt]|uniref:Uncharacterized protein n=1 Tax=Gordonia phage Newt TaxID=2591191 RepID=A0A514A638_9CAUD|nr:hypothetical protein SEA_NEWT_87 [Gordonia phage Newt]UVF60857.1 hypothetical protein SEA_STICKER17_86 [Gordonia phage Sticker17]